MEVWRVVVSGRVQGVYYRQSTQLKAQSLGLVGWVKNQLDGTVLVQIEGQTQWLKQMLIWLKQGPPKAEVDCVRVISKKSCTKRGSAFTILYES